MDVGNSRVSLRCVSAIAMVVATLLVAGCGSSGSSTTATAGEAPASERPATTSTAPSTGATYTVDGTWTDTDVVVGNSCGLPQPAPGTSRTTPGIVIEQSGSSITLTAPPNVAGTQTIVNGTMETDGSMVLTGSDSGATITLDFTATSDDRISGSSQVVADGCTYNSTNTLVRTE